MKNGAFPYSDVHVYQRVIPCNPYIWGTIPHDMWYNATRDHGCGMDHPRFDGRGNNGFEASQRSPKARGDETLQIQELHNKQISK